MKRNFNFALGRERGHGKLCGAGMTYTTGHEYSANVPHVLN